MIKNITTSLLIAASIVIVFTVIIEMMSIPDVHVSYSTNECVKVINYAYEHKYSCEDMPEKFNHIWVK